MNRDTRRRQARQHGAPLSLEGRKHPTHYNADQLQLALVEDAVAHHATDLTWFVIAIQRIAHLRRRTVEQAMNDLLDEVQSITGRRALPIGSGPILGGGPR